MKNLIKKFIEFALGNGIVLLLGFISSPIITRIISPSEFGKFSMFNTITNLLLLILMLGLDQAYIRFFYEESLEARKKLLKVCFEIPLTVNIIVSIILVIFFKLISKFIIGEYSIIIVIMIIIQNTFNIIGRFTLLILRVKQNGKMFSLIQVITKSIYIASVLILFKFFGNNYKTLIYSIVISNVISVIIALILEKEEWIKHDLKIKMNISKKELLKYGIPLVFSMAITWIFQSIDKIFISIFNGYVELGLYSSAFSIIALLNAFQGTFTTFWIPIANQRYQENKKNKNFFSKVNAIISLIMIIIAILIITFKDILILLLGEKYRNSSFIFPFMVFMPVMYTISETTVLGINFMKKTQYHIIIAIVVAGANVLGNFLLVPILAAKGAAISTGISYIIFFSIRTFISKRVYNVNYNLKQIYICLSVLGCLATYASFKNSDVNLIILGFASIIITLFVYRFVLIEFWTKFKKYYFKNRYYS